MARVDPILSDVRWFSTEVVIPAERGAIEQSLLARLVQAEMDDAGWRLLSTAVMATGESTDWVVAHGQLQQSPPAFNPAFGVVIGLTLLVDIGGLDYLPVC